MELSSIGKPVFILGNVYLITLGLDIVIDLGSLDWSFGGSHGDNIEGLLLGDSLGYSNRKVLCCEKVIKLRSTDDKVIGTITVNKIRIKPGIILEQSLALYIDPLMVIIVASLNLLAL